GADGAAALADGELHEAPAHRVEVLDTVGAGDAFVAGYLSAQLEGLDVPARLRRANACGALACTTPGDWEGAPRPAELEALLAGAGKNPVLRWPPRGGPARRGEPRGEAPGPTEARRADTSSPCVLVLIRIAYHRAVT